LTKKGLPRHDAGETFCVAQVVETTRDNGEVLEVLQSVKLRNGARLS